MSDDNSFFQKMKFMRLGLFLLLVSCAYPKKTSKFTQASFPPNKAMIYLYRLPTHVHSLNPDIPKFYVGDQTIGKLLIGGYYFIEVDPGEIDITYKTPLFGIYFPWKDERLRINAKPGKPIFLKFEVTFGLGSVTKFKEVPANVGSVEITKTSLLKN